MAAGSMGDIPLSALVIIIVVVVLVTVGFAVVWFISRRRSMRSRMRTVTGTRQSVLRESLPSAFMNPYYQPGESHILLTTNPPATPSSSTTFDISSKSPPQPLPLSLDTPSSPSFPHNHLPGDVKPPVPAVFPVTPMTGVTLGPLPPYAPSSTSEEESMPSVPAPAKGGSHKAHLPDHHPRPLSRAPSYTTYASRSGWQIEEAPPLPGQPPSSFPRTKQLKSKNSGA